MDRYRVGIEFTTSDGLRTTINPNEIRFVEEIGPEAVQITTERWIKIYKTTYDNVLKAILEWDADMTAFAILCNRVTNLEGKIDEFLRSFPALQEGARNQGYELGKKERF